MLVALVFISWEKRKVVKMKKIIIAGIMVALLISLAGCGKPEAEEGSYEEFVAEYYQTKLALHLLQNKYDELEASHAREEGREQEYINAINTLNSENQALRIEVALIKALGESQKTELESALNAVIFLQNEKQSWARLYKTDYDSLTEKYNRLNALYPPAHFASKDELVKWRASSGNMTEDGCLGLQRRALAEGYIVSLHQRFDYCVAVAGDYLYKITPEDKEMVEKIGKVE